MNAASPWRIRGSTGGFGSPLIRLNAVKTVNSIGNFDFVASLSDGLSFRPTAFRSGDANHRIGNLQGHCHEDFGPSLRNIANNRHKTAGSKNQTWRCWY